MSSALESKIKRLQREIGQLEKSRADAVKDESNSIKKINSANVAIGKTKNLTTIRNKQREIKRENDKIQKAKEKQGDYLTKVAKKNGELSKAMTDLNDSRQKEQMKAFKDQERKLKDYKSNQVHIAENISQELNTDQDKEDNKEYDVFISHSADDKDHFVDDLAKALQAADISTWYDSDDIGWGKSIRQEIDKGLANSRYGIVIISPTFIEKYWTNYELDGILDKESSTETQMILPIWHNVTADQVKKYSHSLSNMLALNTALNTIDDIVENVKKILG